MKNMILSFAMLLGLLSATPAMAAIGCLPGHCNGEPYPPAPPYTPSPKPTVTDASGYFEVASPNCTEEDLLLAQQGAEVKALQDAKLDLGSEDVKQIAPARFLIQKCEQSIYAGSFQGNSWIIYAVVKYSL